MRLEPSSFSPPAGSLIGLRLLVGDEPAAAEPVLRDPRRFVRFVALGPGGEEPVRGIDGQDPAGYLRPPGPGLWVVGYQSRHATLVLAADRFENYLEEEGLQSVRARRAARGESRSPGRERYSRCLKALVVVGPPPTTGADRLLGCPLELAAEDLPARLGPGQPLPLSIRFRGEGLAGVLVKARRLDGGGEVLAQRSDGEGRLRFDLPAAAGGWLVTAVHMVEDETGEADWESFWASLTFAGP